ncbi:MAG: hypothetical protein JO169_15935 [Solirubrobacterales bacterium]|nr:hypothetical protein [Solirubrobacterales bacterium]
MRRPLAPLLVCTLATLAGCGDSRTPVPDLARPASPGGFQTLTYARAGVRITAPRNWAVAAAQAPLVATVASGDAVIALWRFARRVPAPRGAAGLARAGAALIAAARRRDPTLRVLHAGTLSVDGAPAVALEVIERISGQTDRVRSTHLFVPGAELVLEQYAPPARFPALQAAVFAPVLRSLTLLGASAA